MQKKYHKKVYTKQGLQTAISAFEHLAQWTLDVNGDYYIVNCAGYEDGFKDSLFDEFGNFALYGSTRG